MKCIFCRIVRPSTDFYFGNPKCYKCVFSEKLQSLPRKGRKCQICDSYISVTNRWSFCGESCAKIGKKEHEKVNYQQRLRNERKKMEKWLLI